MQCNVPPSGWKCTRESGHDGPCAARLRERPDSSPEITTKSGKYDKLIFWLVGISGFLWTITVLYMAMR